MKRPLMPPIKLKFTIRIQARGHTYWYFRRGDTRIRLPGEPGSADFLAAYKAAAETVVLPVPAISKAEPGTIRALVIAYRASPDFLSLQPSTRSDYEKALGPLAARFGHLPVRTMPRSFVLRLRDEYATKEIKNATGATITVATPRRANRMVAVLRLMLSWGVDRGWLAVNPALRPRMLRTGDGHRAWTEAEVAQFLACEAVSSEMKVAMVLASSSGLRSGDLVAVTWSAWDGRGLLLRIGKNRVETWVPVLAEGRSVLSGLMRRAVTILSRGNGSSWGLSHFQHEASAAIREAGLSGVVWHGLRATYSVRLAQAGASDAELQAARGDKTSTQAAHYRRNADKKESAAKAVARVDRASRNKAKAESVKHGEPPPPESVKHSS